ncbi:hypothetical protein ACFQ34_08410 [Pseudonocardia benzenivorans]|uniref:NAD-dependent epimerase/dehydratase family protein n=1 Tax=Pseudonocardia benzenivorans TaxID=228005 RepID=A0ABW3VG11_9PSEU
MKEQSVEHRAQLVRAAEVRSDSVADDCRKTAPPLTNWLVSWTGRGRSYDITAARTELGYTPDVTLRKGLAEMTSQLAF